jgi:hypothetical protein
VTRAVRVLVAALVVAASSTLGASAPHTHLQPLAVGQARADYVVWVQPTNEALLAIRNDVLSDAPIAQMQADARVWAVRAGQLRERFESVQWPQSVASLMRATADAQLPKETALAERLAEVTTAARFIDICYHPSIVNHGPQIRKLLGLPPAAWPD